MFTMPKPYDYFCKSVPAALTAGTYFTAAMLCDGRDVLGCCQLAVQERIAYDTPSPQPVAGLQILSTPKLSFLQLSLEPC